MSSAQALGDVELCSQLKKIDTSSGPITGTTRTTFTKRQQLKVPEVTEKSIAPRKSVNGNHHIASSSFHHVTRTNFTSPQKAFGFSSDESDNNEEPTKLSKMSASLRNRNSRQKTDGLTAKSSKSQHRDSNVANRRLTRSKGTVPCNNCGYSDYSGDSDELNKEKCIRNTSADSSLSSGALRSRSSPKVVSYKSSTGQSDMISCTKKSTMFSSFQKPNVDDMQSSTTAGTSSQDACANSSIIQPTRLTMRNKSRNRSINAFHRKPHPPIMTQAVATDAVVRKTSKANNMFSFLPPAAHKLSLLSKLFFRNKASVSDNVSFAHSEDSSRSWSLHCSVLLPMLTIVFFVMLGLFYVTMVSDDIASGFVLPSLDFKPNEVENDGDNVMAVVNDMYNILATATGNVICNISSDDTRISVDQLKLQLKIGGKELFKALAIIQSHPEWGVFLYKDELGTDIGKDDMLSSVRFVEAKQPILPTSCRFRRAAGKVLHHLAIILLVVFAIWLMLLCRRYLMRKREEKRQKVVAMVDKILDVLRNHYVTSCIDEKVKPFIPVLHVRDMIISPTNRRSKSREWEEAVRFISANESRVRVETQKIDGEDCRVWRWIQVASPNKRQTPSRLWQGDVVHTNRSTNIPKISPTSCLKIRNMFHPDVEKDVDWHLQIQECILEKCSDNDDILSIVVEKKSRKGLVYVKCASCSGAGKAFQSLHCSWFDGRLVTVKFIKLQRFHTRFPHTVGLKTPLKPNAKNPVSTFLPSGLNSSGFLTPASLISDS